MGPRLFSRGKRAKQPARPDAWLRASMGPRLFSRGKLGFGITGRPMIEASMGPRLFSRGKSSQTRRILANGFRFNGAATFQPRKASQPKSSEKEARLQWGRDFSAAESLAAQ